MKRYKCNHNKNPDEKNYLGKYFNNKCNPCKSNPYYCHDYKLKPC